MLQEGKFNCNLHYSRTMAACEKSHRTNRTPGAKAVQTKSYRRTTFEQQQQRIIPQASRVAQIFSVLNRIVVRTPRVSCLLICTPRVNEFFCHTYATREVSSMSSFAIRTPRMKCLPYTHNQFRLQSLTKFHKLRAWRK